jgi:hypothetical protein
MNRHRSLVPVIGACSVALFLPLLQPLLTGRVFTYTDLSWFHLPTRYLFQQAMQSGDTVLWTPSILSGVYLLGEGQVGLFHPFHQLLYRLLPLQPAFNLELIVNYPAAFAGMYCFLRRLQLTAAAALFGAMLFAFSGFNLLHYLHLNMIAVVAHMPWLLVAADVLIVDDRPRARMLAFAAMAMIIASELLLGFPQGVWWNVMTLAPFAAYRAHEAGRWRRLPLCGAAFAVGTLLGGIQLLPSVDASAHSIRMWLSPGFALSYSLHPANLVQLWSPYLLRKGVFGDLHYVGFHEFGIYSGAILPVALIWVWIRRDALRDRRTFIIGVTAFAAVSLFLAFGRYGGLDVVLTHVPVLRSLRAPARYIVLVQFALVILAAIAMDDLVAIVDGRRDAPAGRMLALWIPAALSVATTLAFNTGVVPDRERLFAAASAAVPGTVFVVAITLLVFMAARRTPSAAGALVFVTMVDLGAWGIRFVQREPLQTIDEVTQGILPAPADTADSYAAAPADGPYRSDVLVLKGYRLTSGYVGLFPASFYPLNGPSSRKFSGTRWQFAPDGFRYRAEGSVARTRLLDESGHEATGVARLVVDRPGRLVADVDAPGRRILAFTERFHDGWSATADGPLQMVRVENDFLGCLVEAGAHRVTLTFMPRSFVNGSIVSAVGAILLAVALIMMGLARPRK